VFFLAGAAKQKCLEVYKAYTRDREEVMQGTKDKGAPLKIQMCKCIVKLVKEQAVPYPACKEGVEAPRNADIGWALSSLSGCNKPSEDGKPWIMVATLPASEEEGAIGPLLSSGLPESPQVCSCPRTARPQTSEISTVHHE